MVVDQHHFAGAKIRVQPAAGVREDQQFDPQGVHHAHTERNVLRPVTLVSVQAAFHGHDRRAGQPTSQQLSAMAGCGGWRKVRNRLVV